MKLSHCAATMVSALTLCLATLAAQTDQTIPKSSATRDPGIVKIAQQSQNKLWYAQPAEKWTSALPIGNGRMGAMVFGGVADERIQFNEDTLWQGKPHDYVRAGAGEQLPGIRRLLSDGKTKEAEKLAKEKFLSDPVRQKPYQPFGDLRLHFPGHEHTTDYHRELDLNSGIVTVSYRVDDVSYKRESFASFPDRAIVTRITGSEGKHVNFTLKIDSPHTNSQTKALSSNTLALTGQVEPGGIRFEARVRVLCKGGQTITNGDEIVVKGADSVTVWLTAATSFKSFQDISGDPAISSAKNLEKVSQKSFETLFEHHLSDYRSLFQRVTLDLGDSEAENLPTDERLSRVKTAGLTSDPALAALFFQYGRYLLIASSRPGSQPANLQGVWNELLDPPWESKWTLNINCEMNYWPVELANLNECHEPLFDMIDDLVISGGRTAKNQYGCHGWVVHHNTDIWRGSAPINGIDGIWPTGGAWLCHHLWEHYLFTGDKKFLAQRAYPAMKSACEFFEDFLIKDPKTGWLVSGPSYSPEQGSLTIGPAMDHQLIRALMTHTIEAADILGIDKDFVRKLKEVQSKIAPDQIGKHGQLQEWLEDIDKPNNNHRHMSPLWALYPGTDITAAEPKLYDGAKTLLKWRGDGSTGWSYAWRIPLWARVGDGEFAYRQLNGMLQRRTLPNLFDLCGPFQIDGNFGATAGIAELLLQSHETEERGERSEIRGQKSEAEKEKAEVRVLKLLPALPSAWPSGSVSGLCARGGFEVDMAWKEGQLTRASVRSKLGGPCRIRYGSRELKLEAKRGKVYELDRSLRLVP